MSLSSTCRCCMTRPPDKDLKRTYKTLGTLEVYADMLKDCFEIHLSVGSVGGDNGVCEVCITRLRDACHFKEQVQLCQKRFQLQSTLPIKEESKCKVKQELSDDDHDIYFADLKEEMLEYMDINSDEEDDKKLTNILNLNNITVKKSGVTVKKAVSVKPRPERKPIIIPNVTKTDKKQKKTSFKKAMSGVNKMLSTPTPTNRFINETSKHKHNIDNILEYSNGTPFYNKTLTGIICAYCKQTCEGIDELRNHTKLTHKSTDLIDKKQRVDKNNLCVKMDITDLECTTCLATFDCISNLKKHLSKNHNVKFYADSHDYIIEFKLSDSDIYSCALCNSTYETFKMLLQHMNGHYRNYICSDCDLGFLNKHRLKNHEKIHELGSFACSYCDKVFSTRVRKMCHEKYTHNTNARYVTNCPQCDKSFTSYYQRNRHMFDEHNTVAATYKCNICDTTFILKSKLTAHIKKVHLMERNHICPECGQGFFIKQSLDEHMVKHNGERVFKCTVCGKAYARKKTLREHMRIHNNDRRFKCGICGLAFVQKCSLKSHMLSNHCTSLADYESNAGSLKTPIVCCETKISVENEKKGNDTEISVS